MVQTKGDAFLGIVNRTLTLAECPKRWKKARLVLVEKPKKSGNEDITTYRPICLINTIGKIAETLTEERVRMEIESLGGLTDNQYCYKNDRSAIQAMERVKEAATEAARGAAQHKNSVH